MSNLKLGCLAIALTLSGLVTTARAGTEKCYEPVQVPASMSCAGDKSSSSDFQTGCIYLPEHIEEKEVACPVGEWVNISQETKVTQNGSSVTQASICKTAGMVPYNVGGKVCASGERAPTVGNGWEAINYRYGKKGGGNGGDGGDKLEKVQYGESGLSDRETSTVKYVGTMCYDKNMGTKNDTKQDAAVAVYCK